MWDDAGVIRTEEGLRRCLETLSSYSAELMDSGLADGERAFNLTWHDWLNLKSLIEVSRVIAAAALARQDSRGAHFREDFPKPGDLDTTCYTRVTTAPDGLAIDMVPVEFSIVRPGQTLIKDTAAAAAKEAIA
jgi:fumarate reductase flavoprotein subunit